MRYMRFRNAYKNSNITSLQCGEGYRVEQREVVHKYTGRLAWTTTKRTCLFVAVFVLLVVVLASCSDTPEVASEGVASKGTSEEARPSSESKDRSREKDKGPTEEVAPLPGSKGQ